MADFFQTGTVATLHRLGTPDLPRLERELTAFSADRPISLVLPCHVRELGTPALRDVIAILKDVPYLRQIVIGIDGADAKDWQRARKMFASLPPTATLLWNDGPRISSLLERLTTADLEPSPTGKGRNLWLCFGYLLASDLARVVAVHDCDILTYDRALLARLCYPVANPTFGFDFCKGYSARFSDQLNGRVMRLLVTPLLRSLHDIVGDHPFLTYLDTFRYPIAGEICLSADLLRRARVPADWGVDIGLLAEIFHLVSPEAICQVDLAERYDHKHQEISPRDATKGLHKMAIDLVKCLLRSLAGHGIKLDRALFDTLLTAYARKAEDTLRFSAADAAINGLKYDRLQEKLAVATFVHSIREASQDYEDDPLGAPLIPNWNRVISALPDFFDTFKQAVDSDNA
jgi:glucosyl-3-phosphoglycerate synthase